MLALIGAGDSMAGKLRPNIVHSADGTMELIKSMVDRYRKHFQLFWFQGDAASIVAA
jgi:hypothetical protein